jgi:hypothetical protein
MQLAVRLGVGVTIRDRSSNFWDLHNLSSDTTLYQCTLQGAGSYITCNNIGVALMITICDYRDLLTVKG